MAKRSSRSLSNSRRRKTRPAVARQPVSVALAERGIESSEDFRKFMVGMMTDVVQGKLHPSVVNAACTAGRGLLRMIEIEYRATAAQHPTGKPSLPLSRRVGVVASA